MSENNTGQLRESLIEIAIEAWRFKHVFERAMSNLDAGNSARYVSQYSWFSKKVNSALENAGLRIINMEGQYYDVGIAATPLNIDEFEASDKLYIEQMIEPIIMDSGAVVRTGTVILGRMGK